MANTHNRVAHAWANQTGKNRRGFNMYYEGDTIYSYGSHFPIAKHVETPDGAKVVLFTTRTYGVSTAKHKTITWRACHHLTVFDVAMVGARATHEHQANYEVMLTSARDCVEKAKRARKYGDMHLQDAERYLTKANDYNAAFRLGNPIVEMVHLDAAIALIRDAAMARAVKQAEERAERQRLQRIEQRKLSNPRMVEWLKGNENVKMYGGNHELRLRPFVRVKGDKVETSWGASVPLDIALTAFQMAAKVRAKGQAWEPKGLRTLMVGDFPLRRIGPTGNLVVGCHDIPYRHMKIAADLAGITLGEMGPWQREA
jgi:hypothetical protein